MTETTVNIMTLERTARERAMRMKMIVKVKRRKMRTWRSQKRRRRKMLRVKMV